MTSGGGEGGGGGGGGGGLKYHVPIGLLFPDKARLSNSVTEHSWGYRISFVSQGAGTGSAKRSVKKAAY